MLLGLYEPIICANHIQIESVLERGEKIDTLVQKSDDLSSQSKKFYTQVCKSRVKGSFHLNVLTQVIPGQEAKLLLCCDVNRDIHGVFDYDSAFLDLITRVIRR